MRKQPAAHRLWNILHELCLDTYFTITEGENPDLLTIESDSIAPTKINGDKFAEALIAWYSDGIALTKSQVEQLILDNIENS
jgi:hypothetical protein